MSGLDSELMRELIDKLNSIGCGSYIELPQIAVMGDTSSGKSSLLSALSGFEFPSSDKLTTRCPTQIVMTSDKTFQATVRLQRFERRKEDEKMGQAPVTLKSTEEIKNAIEKLTQQLVDEGQNISDDCIVINARGPNLPNLTLIDLPGIVRTVRDGEDESMIPRIRALVDRYMRQNLTIILAVIPANVDIHNNEIVQAAQQVDPEGNRTVGIITKPDLVDSGAEEAVMNLLNNQVRRLKLGYHAVKCRGQKALSENKTIAFGLKEEEVFFKVKTPWSTVDKSMVGIPNLQARLVRLLEQMIRTSLPSVQKQIYKELSQTRYDLDALGMSLDDERVRRMIFSKVVDRIDMLTQAGFKGDYGVDSEFFKTEDDDADGPTLPKLRAVLRQKEAEFVDALHNIRILTPGEYNSGDSVDVYEHFNWVSTEVKEVGGYIKDTEDSEHTYDNVRHSLNEIKREISKNRGDEIPLFPSYSVFNTLAQKEIQLWKPVMQHLLETYKSVLGSFIEKVIDEVVHHAGLKFLIQLKLRQELMTEAADISMERLEGCLAHETRPYTNNHYLFNNINEMRYGPLTRSLKASSSTQVSIATVLALIKKFGFDSSTASVEDLEARELFIARSAYLKTAIKRFRDNVPMIIDYAFKQGFVSKIRNSLQLSDSQLEKILFEEDGVKSQRASLATKLAVMKDAHQLIGNFMGSF